MRASPSRRNSSCCCSRTRAPMSYCPRSSCFPSAACGRATTPAALARTCPCAYRFCAPPSFGESSLRVRARATPCGRTFPDHFAKQPREMCLIGQTALRSDFAERAIGRQHQPLSPLDAAPDDVLVRRVADALAERDVEVKRTQAGDASEVFISDRRLQLRVDMGQDPAQ